MSSKVGFAIGVQVFDGDWGTTPTLFHDKNGALVRQLVRLGLVAVTSEVASSPREDAAYVTTPRFLELFGLSSLEDLPRTQDLQKL